MKICKNNLDVIVKPLPKCTQCAFRMNTSTLCIWLKITHINTFDCGAIRINVLSDIFKL